MDDEPARVSDAGMSSNHFYLNNEPLFEYDPDNKKKQWVQKVADPEKRSLSCIGK